MNDCSRQWPAPRRRARSWIAVDREILTGGGEIYDVNCGKAVFFESWLRYAIDLARQLDKKATGGWQVRLGLEVAELAP